MTVLLPARQTTASAAAYARSIRLTNATMTYGGPPGVVSGVASPFGPTMCSTCTPAAAKAGAAAATDWLSRRAPCDPPVTSSVGRSGSSPKAGTPLGAQCAARSRVLIIRRIGRPM